MNATDQEWLDAARFELVLARVAEPVKDELLRQARELSERSGESPEALFGSPAVWAEEQLAARRSEGLPSALPDPAASWRDVPVMGTYAGAAFAAVFFVLSAARREWQLDYSVALVGAPLLGGLLLITVLTTWEKALARRPVRVAVVVGGVALASGAALIGLLLHLTRRLELGTGGVWYLLLLAVALGVVGRVLDGALPEKRRPTWGTPRDDDDWVGVLAGVLRLRADMPESRVRTIIAEARAHVAETGSTLQEEFGRPEDYGAQFPVDEATAVRRRAWQYTALAGLSAVLALPPEPLWWGLAMALLWGSVAARQWWRLLTSGAARR